MKESNHNNESFDLLFLFENLWSRKIFISSITIIFSLISVLWSLSLEDKYTSESLLVINEKSLMNTSSENQIGSGGGISALLGGSISQGVDKKSLAIETIKSRSFIESISQKKGIKEKVIASQSYVKDKDAIIFNDNIYDFRLKKWSNGIPNNSEFYTKFMSDFRISKEEGGFIKLSYTHISPTFAKEMIDIIISHLNEKFRNEDLNESQSALNYLSQKLAFTNQIEIKKSINNLIQENMKVNALANVSEYYLLKPIDPPFVPEHKSYPVRSFIVILMTFSGLIFAVIFVLVQQFFFEKESK